MEHTRTLVVYYSFAVVGVLHTLHPVELMKTKARTSVLLLALFACGGGESSSPTGPAPTPVATTIALSATTVGLSSPGETSQLSATVNDQNGTAMTGQS